MALNSTMLRFQLKISDVDRGVYETHELRVAMHPSESATFLVTRLIAYALNVQEGIEFSDGISNPDEPAIWIKDLTGQILYWIDIGNPSAKRIHKASKASRNVRIYTYRDPQILLDEVRGAELHRKESIDFYSMDPRFLKQVEETLERDNSWEILHTDGEITITVKTHSVSGDISKHVFA